MNNATIAATLYRATRLLTAISGDDARLEAELLLAHALGVDRAHLLARLDDELRLSHLDSSGHALRRRLAREPLSYITGRCEFYGIEIACSPAALIPRPETEMLVEFALDEVRLRFGRVRIADVGTGTGAIAIAIGAKAANVEITATDVSVEALALARANIDGNGVADRVTLVQADLLRDLGEFDVIVANLPYVGEAEWRSLEPEVRDHEPRTALVGGETGLEIIERLLHDATKHLAPRGALAVEIGAGHGKAACRVARARFPGAEVCVMKDFAGFDRMLVVTT